MPTADSAPETNWHGSPNEACLMAFEKIAAGVDRHKAQLLQVKLFES
jgi:hypothetical protein